jgi:uncharacterized protein YuzE
MRVTFDTETDMGYIYLVDEISPGQSARQVIVDDGDRMMAAALDYDAQGCLLGIELFSASRQLHPDLLAIAER